MNEIVTLPLMKLILLLAAVFAPNNSSEFEIKQGETITAYVKHGPLWIAKDAPKSGFAISGRKFLSDAGLIEFPESADAIYQHQWADESILRIEGGIEVLKTSSGLLIYPDGIAGKQAPIEVLYKERTRTRVRVAE